MGKKRKKSSGHWCWSCDKIMSNESFSGRGHARHLCKKCACLGSEELKYRQARNDLCRCVTMDGIIPRKRRKEFDQFLNHPDERIRRLAQELAAEDAEVCRDRMAMDAELFSEITE